MMRKMLVIAGLFLLATAFSGCISERSSSPVEGTLTIPNLLGHGGLDDGITVQFLRVENDSRCAAGVQCVRAGEAFVVIRTVVDGGEPVTSTFEMISGGEVSAEFDRFNVKLLELRPDPPPVGGVEQSEYELLLRIQES